MNGSAAGINSPTAMNRRFVHVVSALVLVWIFVGCAIFGSENATHIRIENASEVDFTSVRVAFPEAEANFGTISSGRRSEYQRVDEAYRYGFTKVEAEGETYRIQPIDYVGEEPLDPGRYTYQLDIVEGELVLELE